MQYEKRKIQLLNDYPAIIDLQRKAQKRIPHVAWEYLQTGTGNEDLIQKNKNAFKKITFQPQFCKGELHPDISTTILGQNFNAPFGVAPVGLTGLMWPKAEVILAKAAKAYQIPFTLSTVATETPETLAPHIGNIGWFQLYPGERKMRDDVLKRAKDAGFHTLVITADVPTPSRRERTKRAGLQMPPKITPRLLWQGMTHPTWSLETLKRGLPELRTISGYAASRSMLSVEKFARHSFRINLSWEYCKELRDQWDGPVILKGILHPNDARKAVEIGLDGIVVSNHGGRQFDGAPPTIEVLPEIVKAVDGRLAILFDSGIRTGLDIMRALHLGADFVLLGRAFLYGVAALGDIGGHHVIEILTDELKNNMMQLGVEKLADLRKKN